MADAVEAFLLPEQVIADAEKVVVPGCFAFQFGDPVLLLLQAGLEGGQILAGLSTVPVTTLKLGLCRGRHTSEFRLRHGVDRLTLPGRTGYRLNAVRSCA